MCNFSLALFKSRDASETDAAPEASAVSSPISDGPITADRTRITVHAVSGVKVGHRGRTSSKG